MPKSLQVHTDSQSKHLYANDASMYEELPQGVAFPKSLQDIRALIRHANETGHSITARSAGTSLAGQATGNGIIMDVSRFMTNILEVDPNEKFARVEPGVIRDTLNRKAANHGLHFGPDTATTNRCMMGGMIGNNSCGIYSIKHKTTREHIIEVEAVLSDGSVVTFKPLSEKELHQKRSLNSLEGHIYRGIVNLIEQHREQIIEAYPHPDIIRRNTGYALDKLCEMQPFNSTGRKFNLAELLCGSEGTLAMTASAKVKLVPQDEHRIVITPHFSSIRKAMEATVAAVEKDPAAVELIDHVILDATKGNIEQRKNRFFLNGEPHCILIIEFSGNNKKELLKKANELKSQLVKNGLANSSPVIEKEEDIQRVWNLRKAGLGLLMGLGSDERTPSFCEDTAVRVADLPEYVDDFQNILDTYHTDCVFYAHASVGELHLRPVIDISKPEGIEKMKAMADDIADLVKHYKGSLSGEHGDGRARAPYIPKVLGEEMMPLLKKVKEIWDPNYIFNPGKIVDPAPINDHLRITSSREIADTIFSWRKEGSFSDALELCNGAGVCRKLAESGGTMCPSYMATKEEKDSTRGRANLFRQLFAGKGPEAFTSENLKDALDLCLSCKACKSECPANVDMAKMKVEFMQGWHNENGTSLSERFFGQAGSFYPLAILFPKFSNWLMDTPVAKELLYQFFNIEKERTLPSFAPETFRSWFKNPTLSDRRDRDLMGKNKAPGIRRTASPATGQKVALLIDLYTNFHEPEIGKAAVAILEAMGFEVLVPDISEIGRPQISKGMLNRAQSLTTKNIELLTEYVQQGIPIIGLEPSELLTLRDEYLELCNKEQHDAAREIAMNSYLFEEFFVNKIEVNPELKSLFTQSGFLVQLHGHCHTKALVGNTPTIKALQLAGYKVKDLETGCCGMAGSFGYEADHYKVSMDIGELVLFPKLRKAKNRLICAPGFSCRHQIKDGVSQTAYHPVVFIQKALKD